ncbi:hypothetical protein NPIL_32721 [Nephila pilipes]|uniref:Uncharacterized protein n=1 Tax=Nephila pilipes TaxID=299642 RepID=A0A8X6N9M7_NEPPI|nr:hypothetical protein NPIL_32721 [Nephila pilipes]
MSTLSQTIIPNCLLRPINPPQQRRALGNRNALDHELMFLALENIRDEDGGGTASRPVLVDPHLKALINMQKTQQSFSCATSTNLLLF